MGTPGPRPVVLDAGALIALERGHEFVRRLVRLQAEHGGRLLVPAAVLAEVWRDGSRQVTLARLVGSAATTVVPLDDLAARAAGVLCGRTGTADVIDASVVVAARTHRAPVVSGDAHDLRRIDPTLEIHPV